MLWMQEEKKKSAGAYHIRGTSLLAAQHSQCRSQQNKVIKLAQQSTESNLLESVGLLARS